jgi:hypothetical protein
VNGELTAEVLSPELKYEALSYTWGAPVLSRTIKLVGGELQITETLFEALTNLRLKDKSRLLWVDQLCINQSDKQEKAEQVSMMADIYRHASRVVVWLGVAGPESEAAFGFMEGITETVEELGMRKVEGAHVWFGGPRIDVSPAKAASLLDHALQFRVDEIYSRPWFSRLWIVQEAFLAKEIIVLCGDQTLDWVHFATATTMLWAAAKKYGQLPRELASLFVAWRIVELRAGWLMRSSPNWYESDRYSNFGDMVFELKGQGCQDERDHVYALLSLQDNDKPLEVSYTKPVAAVYIEWAARYGSMSTLFDAGLARRKSNAAKIQPLDSEYLPSWVPELRKEQRGEWSPLFGDSYNTTSALRGQRMWTPTFPQRLSVQALRYQSVKTIFKLLDGGGTWNEYFKKGLKLLDAIYRHSLSLSKVYPTFEDRDRVFAETIVAGLPEHPPTYIRDLIPPQEKRMSQDQLFLQWNKLVVVCLRPDGAIRSRADREKDDWEPDSAFYKELAKDDVQALRHFAFIGQILEKHSVFFTEHGYMGLAPPDIKEGDEVVVLQGALEPYIVRHVSGSTEFLLIGPCYLHGVMDGETYYNGRINDVEWLALI